MTTVSQNTAMLKLPNHDVQTAEASDLERRTKELGFVGIRAACTITVQKKWRRGFVVTEIPKSAEQTTDGTYLYNFEQIPQGYVKVCNMFFATDKEALRFAEKLNPTLKYQICQEEEIK